MPENLTIEQPDYDQVKKEAGRNTADAIELIWQVLNIESRARRQGITKAVDRFEPKGLYYAPVGALHNYDSQGATILRFDGAASVDLTGIRARVDNAIVIVMVIGVGTITLKHNSGSSEANNRILTQSGGDLAVTTNKGAILVYENLRWRELKLA